MASVHRMLIEGYSLRKSAHKILTALKQMDFELFEGIVEMDETYFLYAEKGKKRNIQGRKPRLRSGSSGFRGISKDQVCVLVARDAKSERFPKQ